MQEIQIKKVKFVDFSVMCLESLFTSAFVCLRYWNNMCEGKRILTKTYCTWSERAENITLTTCDFGDTREFRHLCQVCPWPLLMSYKLRKGHLFCAYGADAPADKDLEPLNLMGSSDLHIWATHHRRLHFWFPLFIFLQLFQVVSVETWPLLLRSVTRIYRVSVKSVTGGLK